ncbi:uncharacterized protein LOC135078131 [Ostrinia nubilalis]|uniref:uncharacterized protein LOC135078131 n=1 Tax=Ostrinia nubilalis TaxID=29057 RepID=UPI00308244D4
MCWSGKCCFFVKLDVGCLLIGIFTLVLSLGISATSLTFICETSIGPNNKDYSYLHNRTEHLLGLVHLDVNPGSKQVVLGIILLVALILAMTSTFLIVGVQKRLSGLVLSYFAYGIFVTFFTILGSLLLLLKTSWWLALILIGLSLIYIHFLVVVNTFYELLLSGKEFLQSINQSGGDDLDVLIETGA